MVWRWGDRDLPRNRKLRWHIGGCTRKFKGIKMLEFIYQSGWGAFTIMLVFQLPFIIGFFYIIYNRSRPNLQLADVSERNISNAKTAWITLVVVMFVVINLASIKYFPAVYTAKAAATQENVVEVSVKAESWSYEFSEQEFSVGQAIRFTANAVDTVHGFGLYHPDGRVIFTMMLVPGVGPSSLIHIFKDPGTYKVRCLEYCGAAHHDMSDEIIVTQSSS